MIHSTQQEANLDYPSASRASLDLILFPSFNITLNWLMNNQNEVIYLSMFGKQDTVENKLALQSLFFPKSRSAELEGERRKSSGAVNTIKS